MSQFQTGGSGTQSATQQTKEKVKETAHDAKQRVAGGVSSATEKARRTAEHTFDDRKDDAANHLHTVAEAIHEAGDRMQEDDADAAAHYAGRYVDKLADRVDELADYMRGRDLTDMIEQSENMVRRHPEVFLGAALVGGLVIGRFFHTSARRRREREYLQDRHNGGDTRGFVPPPTGGTPGVTGPGSLSTGSGNRPGPSLRSTTSPHTPHASTPVRPEPNKEKNGTL